MANGELSKEDMLTVVRMIPGYENVQLNVAPIAYNLHIAQKAKSTGLEKAQKLTENIIGSLRAFNAESHLFNSDPLAAQVSGFNDLLPVLDLIKQRFQSKDTHKYNRCAGPPIDYPKTRVIQVSTAEGVKDMVTSITTAFQSSERILALYVDCEGKNLGRKGKVSVMQIFVPLHKTTYIISAHVLGEELWTISTDRPTPSTLKDIMEHAAIKKVFWGMPRDSEALFFHLGVRLDLAGIVDLQLYDLARYEKSRDRRHVKGMDLAVEKYLNFSWPEKAQWLATKRHGKRMMSECVNYKAINEWMVKQSTASEAPLRSDPTQNDAAEDVEQGCPVPPKVNIWEEFPLRPDVLECAVGDVILLPLLHNHYAKSSRLTKARMLAIEDATRCRIAASHDPMAKDPGHDGTTGWAEQRWCKQEESDHDPGDANVDVKSEEIDG